MVLTEQQLHDWGWRIPFFIGALLAIVVFRIRRGLLETQSFKNSRKNQPHRACLLYLNTTLKKRSPLFLTAGGTLAFYTYTTYLQKYLVNTSGFLNLKLLKLPL